MLNKTTMPKGPALALCLGALLACDKRADDDDVQSTRNEAKVVAPDNAKQNERDRNANAPTPIDQGNNERDLTITQEIRKKVMDKDDFSVNAQNVKIITQDGSVTLRGPVDSAQERTSIEQIARAQVGVTKLTNEITVTGKEEAKHVKE